MKVHGVLQSPFVRKVCIALHEKGLRYEMAPVVPGTVVRCWMKYRGAS